MCFYWWSATLSQISLKFFFGKVVITIFVVLRIHTKWKAAILTRYTFNCFFFVCLFFQIFIIWRTLSTVQLTRKFHPESGFFEVGSIGPPPPLRHQRVGNTLDTQVLSVIFIIQMMSSSQVKVNVIQTKWTGFLIADLQYKTVGFQPFWAFRSYDLAVYWILNVKLGPDPK